MDKNLSTTKTKFQNIILAAAMITLSTLAGVMAGGHWLPLALLSLGVTGLGFWAARRDWLKRAEDGSGVWHRFQTLAVVTGSILYTLLYVGLTGGKDSPLTFALYLPLVLAAICFGARAGVISGLIMACIYASGLTWHGTPDTFSHVDWEGTISFPMVAVTVSLLTKRNEERLLAVNDHARELDTLLDMSQMIDSAIDLEMTLNLILLNVQKLSGCQACAIYLKDSAGEGLGLRAVSAPRGWLPLRPTITLDEVHGASLSMKSIDPEAQSGICFTLTCVEGLLGLLYVGDKTSDVLSAPLIQRLEQLAQRAAFPIQRALTQQDIEALAYSDAMTGLDNYRQFERTLQDELRRSERYGRPLSLLMLDIDHFKAFNDTLGHPAGDILLAQIGTVLRNALRNVDRPARYGGEEFAVVCPETGPDEVHLIAERIRRSVAETDFALTHGSDQTYHVTVSIGYATCCEETCSAPLLIKRADSALYNAKHAGRNTVCRYEETEPLKIAA